MMKSQFLLGLVLLSDLCQGQMSAAGTLVAVVPANGGIIVAADTRTTVAQVYCDGRSKLFVPQKRKNIVVFETGEGIQLPISGATPLDICGYLIRTPPLLDVNNFIVKQLDANPKRLLTRDELQTIARHTVSRVMEYGRKYETISPLNRYLGHEMFRAVIVSYDAKRGTGLLGSFVIQVDSLARPGLGDVQWLEFAKADKADLDMNYFGETDYVSQYVSKLGRSLLGPCLALAGKTVSQTSLSDAKSAALSIITATEETAKSIPPPHGIGGPIDVATITKMGTVLERR